MNNNSKQSSLKSGFTTGAAAAAAAKAALILLIHDQLPKQVSIALLTEKPEQIQIPIADGKKNEVYSECLVQKDAGDDPDVTNGAIIGARVRFIHDVSENQIKIIGGVGVGVVTKPGLEIRQGEPAINLGPRTMIRNAIKEVLSDSDRNEAVELEIFVPEGMELAKKTMNQRLGIIGGISILGTTGIVKPLSHEAYIASIRSAFSVAKASNVPAIVLTTGRRSEKFAQQKWQSFPEEAFIQIGDHFKCSLDIAKELNLTNIILAVFFGKAVKIAMGFPNTHAAKSRLDMKRLSEWIYSVTQDKQLAEAVQDAVTVRHVLEMIRDEHIAFIEDVGKKMITAALNLVDSDMSIQGVIFDYDGKILFNYAPESKAVLWA